MNFYTQQHKQYCGINLQAKARYVCILDQRGTKLVHKNLPMTPEAFLRILAPYREDLVVGVEGMFTWDWLADLGAQEGIAFVLGQTLSMQASQGGKAQNDTIDAHKCGLTPWRDVPSSLRLSSRDARHPRLTPAPLSLGTQKSGTVSSHPQYQQSIQPARDRQKAGLQGES